MVFGKRLGLVEWWRGARCDRNSDGHECGGSFSLFEFPESDAIDRGRLFVIWF